jgi:hypothetical protein
MSQVGVENPNEPQARDSLALAKQWRLLEKHWDPKREAVGCRYEVRQ